MFLEGYFKHGSSATENLAGGGQLPLSITSVQFLCMRYAQDPMYATIKILWIGCGFGEEAIVMAKYFQNFYPAKRFHIFAVEMA